MAENDGQERTEQATPKRIEDARKKGQIPRSKELNTMGITMAAAAAFMFMGADMMTAFGNLLHDGLTLKRDVIFNSDAMASMLGQRVMEGLWLAAPFFAVTFVVAIFVSAMLGGWSFSVQSMAFKIEKLSLFKGMKRMFSMRGLMELVKALLKFILISTVATLLLYAHIGNFLSLGHQDVHQAMAHAGEVLVFCFLILSSTLLVIAAIDVPFQLWDHAKNLKMTRQEIKDENKDIEGKPEVKQKIRNLQHEMAERRMMTDVPKADVVVTNPSHYAVALRYDTSAMGAPVVVAKGQDLIAAQIRDIASNYDVPVLSTPPLARALFFSTELEKEIPAGLYLAVAQVLAYVYQIKTARENGSNEPDMPANLPIPDELRRDEDGSIDDE
ncbi:MAG: flagellar biosynthesis protein FlhB [Gammaproteobacteria bacterium]|nr:flagellar biosynthesis protein FlhB [Gammaproteobacteria bacterium]